MVRSFHLMPEPGPPIYQRPGILPGNGAVSRTFLKSSSKSDVFFPEHSKDQRKGAETQRGSRNEILFRQRLVESMIERGEDNAKAHCQERGKARQGPNQNVASDKPQRREECREEEQSDADKKSGCATLCAFDSAFSLRSSQFFRLIRVLRFYPW